MLDVEYFVFENEKVKVPRKQSKETLKGGNGYVNFVTVHGKELAVKILQREDQKRTDRFYREIEATSKIQIHCENHGQKSPVIPIIYHSDRKEKLHYYVMPKCKPIDPDGLERLEEIIKCLYDVVYCLSIIHKMKISHRDIKASNVLFHEGMWKLSDYGLAFSNLNPSLSDEGKKIGPFGGPPELMNLDWQDEIRSQNYIPSDIYLLGKLIWQLVTREKQYFTGPFLERSYQSEQFIQRAKAYNYKTVGPLFKAIRMSVIDNPAERCSLEEIKQCLEEQKRLLVHENNFKDSIVQSFWGQLIWNDCDHSSFTNPSKIHKCLKTFIGASMTIFGKDVANKPFVGTFESSGDTSYKVSAESDVLTFSPNSLEISYSESGAVIRILASEVVWYGTSQDEGQKRINTTIQNTSLEISVQPLKDFRKTLPMKSQSQVHFGNYDPYQSNLTSFGKPYNKNKKTKRRPK